jgi:2'-5' RNA ligase
MTAADLYQRMMKGERYKEWKKNFETTEHYVDEDTHVEAFVLPSSEWSEKYSSQLVCIANHKSYLGRWPRWVRDDVQHGTHTAVVPANLLYMMPTQDHDELYEGAINVKDNYPLVDNETHSALEMEYQEKAWVESGREEFTDFLKQNIADDFEDKVDKYGEPVADRMIELLTPQRVDTIFYELEHNGGGDHWEDHQGTGDYSLDIKRLLTSNYIKDVPHNERYAETLQGIYDELYNELYPEDPRQMKFPFADEVAERLLENAVDISDNPSPAALILVATLLESHDYSCLMINLPDELADQIIAWGKQQIPEESLFVDKDGDKGREDEIHVTLKYGLLDAMPSPDLKELFRNTKPFEIALAPITLFRQDDHDVVKLDVHSAQLHALNREVCSIAPYHDTYPDYHPHITLCYVKKGTCDRLEGVSPFDDPVKLGVSSLSTDGKFTAKSVVFSSHTDVKKEYALGGIVVKEAMTPQELIQKVGLTPEEQPFGTIRRRVGKELVDAVWIDKVDKKYDPHSVEGCGFGIEGELRIFFHGKRAVKSEFCSYEVLKMSVRQWRNMYGARLFVNGKQSGVVSYSNPALQDEKTQPFRTRDFPPMP